MQQMATKIQQQQAVIAKTKVEVSKKVTDMKGASTEMLKNFKEQL